MSWWKQLFGQQPAKQSAAFKSEHQPPKAPSLSNNEDHLYPEAVALVTSTGSCSISALQRHLKIGYNRAATLIEALEDDLIISPITAEGSRHLLSETERFEMQNRPSKTETLRKQQDDETSLRLSYLLEKYSDEQVIKQIMKGVIWEGMTSEQLFDSAGQPEAVDQKYLKSKSREVWKYHHQGANRYGLRVTLEDGFVVGWESKS